MKTLLTIFLVLYTCILGAVTPQQLNSYSAEIDNVLHKQCIVAKIMPRPVVDDDAFLRRSYLTIIGRNPTYDECYVQ
jgi:hypothetical protein